MKRIIKNLLVGIVPFLPTEKAHADPDIQSELEEVISVSSRETDKEAPLALEKILNGDFKSSNTRAGVEQIEELIALIEEYDNKEKNSQTNTPEQVTSNTLAHIEQNQPTNTQVKASCDIPGLSNENTTKTNNPEVVSSILTNTLDKTEIKNQSLPHEKVVSTNVSEVISSPITNTIPVDKTYPIPTSQTNVELVAKNETVSSSNTIEETKTQSSHTTQSDLEELLALSEKTVPPSNKEIPIKERSWFPWAMSLLLSGLVIGSVWFSDKLERIIHKKQKKKKDTVLSNSTKQSSQSEMTSETQIKKPKLQDKKDALDDFFSVENEEDEYDPDEPKTTFLDPEKMQAFLKEVQDDKAKAPKEAKAQPTLKKEKPTVLPIENEEEARQKGIRMMSNIKMRRIAINRQMKALRAEIQNHHQSESRWLEIVNEMNDLQEQRNQLTKENRYARTLVKGKQGELIQQERRLYAKEMRLAKKANDEKKMIQIIQKRAILKGREKDLIKAAQEEAKERIETATWWHGKRLYSQALQKEGAINQKIKELKKEKRLKKKDILAENPELNESLKKAQREKRLACQQMKGRKFTQQRRLLSKQIIEAHNIGDVETENQLKEELNTLKTKEKEHMTRSKNFDYDEGKREIVPFTVAQHAERRNQANRWKGYRMLRDLNAGIVRSVNTNEISAQEYETMARTLIGKSFDATFDYAKSRASALKPSTLAHIYLNKKERGLI